MCMGGGCGGGSSKSTPRNGGYTPKSKSSGAKSSSGRPTGANAWGKNFGTAKVKTSFLGSGSTKRR